jgi:hypothetical protein
MKQITMDWETYIREKQDLQHDSRERVLRWVVAYLSSGYDYGSGEGWSEVRALIDKLKEVKSQA